MSAVLGVERVCRVMDVRYRSKMRPRLPVAPKNAIESRDPTPAERRRWKARAKVLKAQLAEAEAKWDRACALELTLAQKIKKLEAALDEAWAWL